MKTGRLFTLGISASALLMPCLTHASDFPEPQQGDFVIKDFTFHSGEVFPELKVHYYTVGDPASEPVLILHGTTGSGKSMLSDGFAGALFGPGQALDASRYFLS
jgi:homoserine O-acetyltransferase